MTRRILIEIQMLNNLNSERIMDLGFPIRYLQNRINEFRLDLHRLRLYRSESWNYDVEQRIKEYEQAVDILTKANGVEQGASNCNKPLVSVSVCPECGGKDVRPYKDHLCCYECGEFFKQTER